jgi:hypothetical protein
VSIWLPTSASCMPLYPVVIVRVRWRGECERTETRERERETTERTEREEGRENRERENR